jgi:DNA-binding NarL/FixJ family response regulator
MSRTIARKVIQYFHRLPVQAAGLEKLTERELELLKHLARGHTDQELAQCPNALMPCLSIMVV